MSKEPNIFTDMNYPKTPPMRADARQSYDAILAAARAQFSNNGIHVLLEDIISQSGISRATFYRHFYNRAALMEALSYAAQEDIAQQLSARCDAGADFAQLLDMMVEGIKANLFIYEYWWSMAADDTGISKSLRQLIATLFTKPLIDAIATGRYRTDLCVDDVFLCVRMLVGAALRENAKARTQRIDRAFILIKQGLYLPKQVSDDGV